MKTMKPLVITFVFAVFNAITFAQDTFTIIAIDSATRKVGAAGASCVDLFQYNITDGSFLADIFPDTGVIVTQAYYDPNNQIAAAVSMRIGNIAQQIINEVNQSDSDSTIRQYGVLRFNGNNIESAAFSGTNCYNYKNHLIGNADGFYYSIQGNILLGQLVLDSMEAKFRKASGDLSCKLMAALQGANMVGADTRCTNNGTSSLFAFIKVYEPSDQYNYPSFLLNVRTHNNTHIEPIDSLQVVFNQSASCNTVGIEQNISKAIAVFPNPVCHKLNIITNTNCKGLSYCIYDVIGKSVKVGILESKELDLTELQTGVYILKIESMISQPFIKN